VSDNCDTSLATIFENLSAEQYLSVPEISKLLGVSEKTVRGWVYKKILKPVKLGPRLIRFKKEDIELWISQSKGEIHGN
jgi:excisionase family DNA binding protein